MNILRWNKNQPRTMIKGKLTLNWQFTFVICRGVNRGRSEYFEFKLNNHFDISSTTTGETFAKPMEAKANWILLMERIQNTRRLKNQHLDVLEWDGGKHLYLGACWLWLRPNTITPAGNLLSMNLHSDCLEPEKTHFPPACQHIAATLRETP